MAKGKNKLNKGAQGSVSIKHVEMDGRSIAIMSESGALAAKTASYAGSSERCESDREDFEEEPNSEDDAAAATVTADPPGVRQNALVKTGITQFETSTAGEESKSAGEGKKATGEEKEAGKVQRKNPSFAGLFTGNRMPTEDSKLEFFNQDEEMAIIELEDIQESDFHWERCLIGYFSGKIPREASP
ncbi:hypothetical protein Acr_15g0015700 [Actinidia rufa]|uniref:Uncharacterized protein n=1 Tax=Actinidia rufa TaxID=165716 RepID=A0A7J0FW93_9ERIC|nr:hypothetical protein Acr_15g0015700 [Actinidia rufa]